MLRRPWRLSKGYLLLPPAPPPLPQVEAVFTAPLRRFLEAGPGYSHRDVEWQPGLPYRCGGREHRQRLLRLASAGAVTLVPPHGYAVPPCWTSHCCLSPYAPKCCNHRLHYFDYTHRERSYLIWGLTAGMLIVIAEQVGGAVWSGA